MYYATYRDKQQTYLGKKASEVELLQQLQCAQEVKDALDQDISLLDELLTNWKPYHLCDIREQALCFQELSDQVFEALGFIDPQAWANAPYIKSDSYPENLIHQTRSGRIVRSRGEVIISDFYDEIGIPSHYEELLELPNGAKWFVDFTILVKGRIKWHDHFGNLKEPENLKRFLWKEQQCIMAGVRPYEDILFTFDGYNGEINTRYLYRSIEEFVKG